jgi:hypothetical protein
MSFFKDYLILSLLVYGLLFRAMYKKFIRGSVNNLWLLRGSVA